MSNIKLAFVCIALGLLIHFTGWAKYPIISILISLGIGFSIRLCRKWLKRHYPQMNLSLQFLLAVTFSFVVWGLTPLLLGVVKSTGGYVDDWQQYVGMLLIGSFIMVVVSFTYYQSIQAQDLKQSLAQVELDQIKKDKVLLETELRLLQSQIEPHFLFNTLANIQALIAVDTKQANKMLIALTALLRQSLDRTRSEWLTLGHELRFNKAYLAIQKIRLGDRLVINYDITDKITDDILFPPMLLQPLIENALTHGIEQLTSGGELILSVEKEESNLVISITNNIPVDGSNRKGTQVGMNNVKTRLQQLYEGQASLKYDNSQVGKVVVTMEVPLNVSQS